MKAFALVDTSDNSIASYQEWDDSTSAPTTKAGFEWLPIVEGSKPAHDPHRQAITHTDTVSASQVDRAYSASLLSAEDRKSNADTIYRQRVAQVISEELQLRSLTRAVQLLTIEVNHLKDSQSNPAPTSAEAAEMATFHAVGAWQYSTRQHLETLQADIDNGNDPALDTGWPAFPGS